jgi:nucleoid-associated protein YgaU
VQTGESLGAIAQRYYGKSSDWKRILNANPDVLKGNPKKLKPGQKLRIPKG